MKLFVVLVLALLPAVGFAEAARDPQTIYETYCFTCHDTGWESAPVVGDSFEWEPRKEQGIEVLLQHTVEGFHGMPPKGGCMDCSEEELRSTIEWMTE